MATVCTFIIRVFALRGGRLTWLHVVELDADVGEARRRRRHTLARRAAVACGGGAAGRQPVRTSGLAGVRRRHRAVRTQQPGDVRRVQGRASWRRRVRMRRVAARARRATRVVSRAATILWIVVFGLFCCPWQHSRRFVAAACPDSEEDITWREVGFFGIGY